MISFPHCKINLGLHVAGKRSDGFHDLSSCFYPVPRTDILEIIPAQEFSFSLSGMEVLGASEDNLCVKAYQLIKKYFDISPAKIHLHKTIPIGAGLGGGSADAAFTLRLLCQVFDLKISNDQLKYYAAQLGSDCTFFLQDQPMMGSGRGEILSPTLVNLKGKQLVLVKPNIHISTSEAYENISPHRSTNSIDEILKSPVKEWRGKLKNDFEESIFITHPALGAVKEKLYLLGAMYSSMSGSGASVFGIFEKPVDLKKDFSRMDYWSGELK